MSTNVPEDLNKLRTRTVLVDEALKMFEKKQVSFCLFFHYPNLSFDDTYFQIQEGETTYPVVPKKRPLTKIKGQIQTNGFCISMKKQLPVYLYRVEGKLSFVQRQGNAQRRDYCFTHGKRDQ
jgi:hypothetical protein